jgi:AcrR family transcriptional regulator
MARKPAPGTRDCILDVAAGLFYEHGVHAVGLQQIIDGYGCGKNLLYREFPSKDDLVVAWLERCRQDWAAKIERITGPLAGDPAAQLVAIVRAAADDLDAPGYRGCALRNTHVEFPDRDHPAHRVSVEYVNEMRALLHELAEQAHARDPATLADRLMLILDGLLTNGALLGADGAAGAAVEFAEELVRDATPRRRSRNTPATATATATATRSRELPRDVGTCGLL